MCTNLTTCCAHCCQTWIRTKILSSRGRSPTIRRSGNTKHNHRHSLAEKVRACLPAGRPWRALIIPIPPLFSIYCCPRLASADALPESDTASPPRQAFAAVLKCDHAVRCALFQFWRATLRLALNVLHAVRTAFLTASLPVCAYALARAEARALYAALASVVKVVIPPLRDCSRAATAAATQAISTEPLIAAESWGFSPFGGSGRWSDVDEAPNNIIAPVAAPTSHSLIILIRVLSPNTKIVPRSRASTASPVHSRYAPSGQVRRSRSR